MIDIRVLLLTFAIFTTVSVSDLQPPAEVLYAWKYMNFTWESAEQYQEAVAKLHYIPKNNAISGIKIWEGQLYLTIPRLRIGVAATLVVTPLHPVNDDRSPNVQPYPNWEMQKLGDCNGFQFVQSVEIDPYGRMWVIDTGRNGLFEINQPLCPPSLVILDLNNNGTILMNYKFPKDVVNPLTCYLNDIVLDETDGGYAYIANTDLSEPSIVVFSLKQRKSWAMKDKSMYSTAPNISVKLDQTVIAPFTIDSIALTPASGKGERQFYYAPLSSYNVFCVPTAALKGDPKDFASNVTRLGKKPSQTDGMMMTAGGELYFGLVAYNQVSKWNRSEFPFTKYQQRVFEDDESLMWPDSFAIGQCGNLWVTSNKLQRQYTNTIRVSKFNFRVVKLMQLDYLSYQYYKNGTAPVLPEIEGTSGATHKSQPMIHSQECIDYVKG